MPDHQHPAPGGRVAVLGPIGIAVPGRQGDGPALDALGLDQVDMQPVSGQQGLVLGLLAAHHPHVVAGDLLIDALWPTNPPRSAATGLRVVVNRLRERLADVEPGNADPITHQDPGYRLTVGADRIDHRAFTRWLDGSARTRDRRPGHDVARLEAALRLWRGRAYSPYESTEHLAADAIRLESRRCQAEELLLEGLLDAGRNESAAMWATSFVATEPYRERRWELLMLSLYRAGRQAEALAAAERVRSILVDDLGLEPGPSLQRLELDILNHEPRLDGPIVSSTDDQPEPPEVVANLRPRPRPVPRTATSYVEPDDVHLADVATSAPMVTLAGPPGVGKSRLAARLVSGLVDRNVDVEASAAVHWLDLADGSLPGRSDETLRSVLAGTLGIRPTTQSLVEAAGEVLAGTPTIIVFDNADHHADAVAELAEELLEVCPDLSIVVTSRFPLGTRSEKVYPVQPLSPTAAVRLLVDRAPVAIDQPEDELLRLVDQVDRLPLAIELVAPHLATLGAGDVADRLVASLELASGRGRLDRRHQSLDQALAWSADLLDDDDKALLITMAVYEGTVSTQQIIDGSAGGTAAAAGLRRLRERGLIRSPTGGRSDDWTLPNTVRTHVLTHMAAPAVLADHRRAHAELHLRRVTELAVDLTGPGEEGAVAELRKLAHQLPAAHRWFVEHGRSRQSAVFSLAMWEYSFFRQDYATFGWIDDTLGIDGIDETAEYPELLAQGALAAWAQDRLPLASSLAARAEAEAERRHQPFPIAAYKARLNVAAREDRMGEAARHLGRLLEASEQRGDVRHHSDNLVVATLAYCQAGLGAEAQRTAHHALDLAVSLGNPTCVAWARVGSAWADMVEEPERSARQFAAAARLARTVDNRWVNGMATTGLAIVLRRQGRIDHARRLLIEVTKLWVRARQQGQISRVGQEAVLLLGHPESGATDRNRAAILVEQLLFEGHRMQVPPDDQDRFNQLARSLVVQDRAALGDAPLGRLVIEALGR